MSKIAIGFGLVLGIYGVFVWGLTGMHAPTALIPAIFGVLLIVCGALAFTDDAKKRMLWMHIAVTVGLLGFLIPAVRAGMALAKAHSEGVPVARPAAVHEEVVMAAICLVFVLLCVRSFIAARRAGTV